MLFCFFCFVIFFGSLLLFFVLPRFLSFFLSFFLSYFLSSFASLYFLALLPCLSFLKRTSSKCSNWTVYFINPFCVSLVSCRFCLPNPFFLSCLFLVLSCISVRQHSFLSFNKDKFQCSLNLGVAKQQFSLITFVFMWIVIVFRWPNCGPNYVDVQTHCTLRCFSTFLQGKKNKSCILWGYYLGQVGTIVWASFGATNTWPTSWPRQ